LILPVAAFLVTTKLSAAITQVDYDEFAKVVKKVLSVMYNNSFASNVVSRFMGIDMAQYSVLSTYLINFDISVDFATNMTLPTLDQVQNVTREALQTHAEYYDILLMQMREMKSAAFSGVTSIRYIDNESDLKAASTQAQSSASVVRVVLPAVAGGLLLVLSIVCFIHQKRRNRRTLIMNDEYANEVKHCDSIKCNMDDCDMTAASQSTFSTRFCSKLWPMSPSKREQPRRSQITTDGQKITHDETIESDNEDEYEEEIIDETSDTLQNAPSYDEVTVEDEMEELLEDVDFEDVNLYEAKKSDAKESIGEIRKSAFLRDRMVSDKSPVPPPAAEIKKHIGELPRKPSANVTPSFSYTQKPTKTNHVGEINKKKFECSATRSTPVTLKTSTKPRQARTLHPDDDLQSQALDNMSGICEQHSVIGSGGISQKRIFQASTWTPPVVSRDEASVDESIVTIDSQSSSTPEFLKKFKQMGLHKASGINNVKRQPTQPEQASASLQQPQTACAISSHVKNAKIDPTPVIQEDEASVFTIDSQSSATPEFLKKFKQMGLKRDKNQMS
jgi:hypothetical protein